MEIIDGFNNNKYVYAVMMILLNVGARYIEMDLVDDHKLFLSSTILRRLLIFTVAFVATKDVVASLIITASFVIIVLNLFNTDSKYCIIPPNLCKKDEENNTVTAEQIQQALNILKKAGKIN